jgi:hypothetical protein
MDNNMNAMMSIVEKEAHEKGCWVEKQESEQPLQFNRPCGHFY